MKNKQLPIGIHYGIPDADYFADDSISRSDCVAIDSHSLAHWRADQERRAEGDDKPSPAMVIGSASHVALLEPEAWAARYIIVPSVEKVPADELATVGEIVKTTAPALPPVERTGFQGPVKINGDWKLPDETGDQIYATKGDAAAVSMAWKYGDLTFVKRADANAARKIEAAKHKPYAYKGKAYSTRADALADRVADSKAIIRYTWDGNSYTSKEAADLARVTAIGRRSELSPGDATLSRDMAAAMRAHAKIGRCFETGAGRPEVTAIGVLCGVRVRVRLDWLVLADKANSLGLDSDARADPGADLCIDYKTSRDARSKAFTYSCLDYGYAMQAAMYSDVYKQVTGRRLEWLFAVVEKRKPYGVKVYRMAEDFIEYGRRGYRRALAKYAAAKESGRFPGYAQGVEILQLPASRKLPDLDNELNNGGAQIKRWRAISKRAKR